jgi:acyl-CoA thioesterase I
VKVLLLLASVATLSVACSAPGASPTPPAPATPDRSSSVGPRGLAEPALASQPAPSLRYVALGDSYTIGEGVNPRERWPNQLVRRLDIAPGLELVANFGATGATTAHVLAVQLPEMEQYSPGFVSLLIGVNDVVQGVAIDEFRHNLRLLLDRVLEQVPADRVLTLTIPDYTLTPQGPRYGGRGAQARVAAFNGVVKSESSRDGVVCVDIAAVAREVASNQSLVADDGLHPSGRQYAAWVELIVPRVRRLLSESPVSSGTQ